MERALARGHMPFLRSLIAREHYRLGTHYSGIPSTTSAVQAEILYDVRCAVPSFSFFDRSTGKLGVMFKPDCVKSVESGLQKEGGEPLLKGGSSWSNIYSGGARPEETHFCAAGLAPADLVRGMSFLGFLGLLVFHFPALLRILGLLAVEFFLALVDVVRGVWRGQNIFKEIKFVLSRVFISVGLREAVTIGAGIDLARGLPIVLVNFLGYDEQSHRRGPSSAFAHLSLRGIDFAIKKLYLGAQRSGRRDYHVWIYSDHGQESVHPLPAHVEGGIESILSRGLAAMAREMQAVPAGHAQPAVKAEAPPQESAEPPFFVTALGPVGHVYFRETFSVEQKRTFSRWLVGEGKVPGILFLNEDGNTVWMHAGGESELPGGGATLLPHAEPLRREISSDLAALARHRFSGDIVLLGWQPDRRPWSFVMENGAHGGPGLEETQGFLLVPDKTRLPHESGEFIRPSGLRRAALHALRRQNIPVRRRPAAPASFRRVRVMTYNVHSCRGMDGKISPHRIARVIQRYEPDLVALQEIDLGRERTRFHDQARLIAEELEMEVTFCPTVTRGTELYGHALLSRFPITVIHSGLLPAGPGGGRREPRGALLARVEFDTGPLHILNTHFGLGRSERTAQAAALVGEDWWKRLEPGSPFIACGDFNMFPGSAPYRTLASHWRDVQLGLPNYRPIKTFSTLVPFSRIDHIFVSEHFEVEQVRVPHDKLVRVASDHLPLIADLRFAEKPKRP